jgi:hypothetical protein
VNSYARYRRFLLYQNYTNNIYLWLYYIYSYIYIVVYIYIVNLIYSIVNLIYSIVNLIYSYSLFNLTIF